MVLVPERLKYLFLLQMTLHIISQCNDLILSLNLQNVKLISLFFQDINIINCHR